MEVTTCGATTTVVNNGQVYKIRTNARFRRYRVFANGSNKMLTEALHTGRGGFQECLDFIAKISA